MELIPADNGKWYWCIDDEIIGFAESIYYKKKQDAIAAAVTGTLKWHSNFLNFSDSKSCTCADELDQCIHCQEMRYGV
uniref:Uncharacterized protein n=1 Tax=viral metagenome TaxID=1070528 RepID=A0A6M3JPZ9_9ZZZZ